MFGVHPWVISIIKQIRVITISRGYGSCYYVTTIEFCCFVFNEKD